MEESFRGRQAEQKQAAGTSDYILHPLFFPLWNR